MSIKRLIEDAWSHECIMYGLSCQEKGRKFSLKRRNEEEAVILNLEECSEWPSNEKRCDCVLCCRHQQDMELTVVFIELKGVNVKDSLEQIKESKRLLCRSSGYFVDKHGIYKRHDFSLSHAQNMQALVIPSSSLSQRQLEKSRFRKRYRIDVRQKTKKFEASSVRELQRVFS